MQAKRERLGLLEEGEMGCTRDNLHQIVMKSREPTSSVVQVAHSVEM